VSKYLRPWLFTRNVVVIPIRLLEYPKLTPEAKMCWVTMSRFSNASNCCFASREKLASVLAVSVRSVDRYLDELRAANLIETHRGGDGQTAVHNFLEGKDILGEVVTDERDKPSPTSDTTEMADLNSDTPPMADLKTSDTTNLSGPIRKKSLTNRKNLTINSSPIPPTESSQNKTDPKEFIWQYQRGKGIGSIRAVDRAAMAEFLDSTQESSFEVMAALDEFLRDDYWRKQKFPLAAFRKQYSKYLELSQSSNGSADAEAGSPEEISPPVGPTHADTTPIAPRASRDTWRKFLDRWNELVPGCPTEPLDPVQDAAYIRSLEKLTGNPKFVDNFDELCKRAQEFYLNATPDWAPDFKYILGTKNGVENWWKLLKSLRPLKKSRKPGSVDTVSVADGAIKLAMKEFERKGVATE
jgi:hypothetical protein